MIIADPEAGASSPKVIALAYRLHQPLRFKETCFGLLAEGERPVVRGFLERLRDTGYKGLLFRRRGYSIADTRVCARTFRAKGPMRRAMEQLKYFNRS